MPYNKSERPDSPMRRRGGRRRKKVCAFCANENKAIDYKDVATLKRYVSERGKILPRRITGTVSYTHLDVYKRQKQEFHAKGFKGRPDYK